MVDSMLTSLLFFSKIILLLVQYKFYNKGKGGLGIRPAGLKWELYWR